MSVLTGLTVNYLSRYKREKRYYIRPLSPARYKFVELQVQRRSCGLKLGFELLQITDRATHSTMTSQTAWPRHRAQPLQTLWWRPSVPGMYAARPTAAASVAAAVAAALAAVYIQIKAPVVTR